MARDLFTTADRIQENVYEYDLNALREVENSQVSHKESKQIKIDAEEIHAIAVDQKDNIYVGTNKNVFVLDPEGKQINSLKLRETAYCLTLMEDGNIVVGLKKRIDIRKPDGSLSNSFVVKGDRTYITSVAVQDNNIFVADAGQKIIHHYDLEGNKIKEIGNKNPGKGIKGFVIPSPYFDLLIGRQGELWAVNPGRHAFEAYNFEGEQISNWNRTSMSVEGFSGCCNPSNIAMLSDGSFVTAEKGLERVKIHLPSGDFKSVVAAPKLFEAGTIGIDLAVDSNDRILVLDPTKRLIRIFEKK